MQLPHPEFEDTDDPLVIDKRRLRSRLFLGTAAYPSPQVLAQSLLHANTQVVTVALKRQLAVAGDNGFIDLLRPTISTLGAHLLPNTAGCRTTHEAVQLAHMARELYATHWIKLEVIGDEYTLQPDPLALIDAARQLVADGFTVFPYCTDDLVTCKRLLDVGCPVLMPWGAPIGSGQGLINVFALSLLRKRLPGVTLIIDAGLGAPSHAALAMELGFDAVLLNSAVSQALDPAHMARAFALGVRAGRTAYLAGLMQKHSFAVASTPVLGTALLLEPQ